MGLLKKKLLIQIVVLLIAFIVGIIVAPFLKETTYHLREWIGRQEIHPATEKVVTLYFSSPEGEELVPVKRKIWIEEENINSQIKAVVEELVKGPQNGSFMPTLPPETSIKAVYTAGNIIYVDFSSSLIEKHPGGTSGEIVTVYSIVNTLLENFPDYSRVQILIEGSPHHTLAGHIDIREPLKENREIIKGVGVESG